MKGFLVVKGNFSQRQFDKMVEIWNQLGTDLRLIQLTGEEGNIGLVSIDYTNEIKLESLF